MLITLESESVADTVRIGRALAECLTVGDVVALDGELGAGKTHLVQGIATTLGVNLDDITSPTFVIIQEYSGRVPICHIDAYRLNDVDEFLELGADELLGGNCIALIEWANRVEDVLPRDRIHVQLKASGENSRTLIVTGKGSKSQRTVMAFIQKLSEQDS